ncbi:hypothetical protein AN2V17_16750 [Vallitalea sp. AN17-2]|uniref:Uncharacterized protein n=1 Tax=Vallitalea maricola TaxID=3074433 RepID=A0ACB5UKK9_9FIRM|nr:hypothetical protein AN2V17_16750 [Vallitalea sp. AN17-2]
MREYEDGYKHETVREYDWSSREVFMEHLLDLFRMKSIHILEL